MILVDFRSTLGSFGVPQWSFKVVPLIYLQRFFGGENLSNPSASSFACSAKIRFSGCTPKPADRLAASRAGTRRLGPPSHSSAQHGQTNKQLVKLWRSKNRLSEQLGLSSEARLSSCLTTARKRPHRKYRML